MTEEAVALLSTYKIQMPEPNVLRPAPLYAQPVPGARCVIRHECLVDVMSALRLTAMSAGQQDDGQDPKQLAGLRR